jgi:hypothetical protein
MLAGGVENSKQPLAHELFMNMCSVFLGGPSVVTGIIIGLLLWEFTPAQHVRVTMQQHTQLPVITMITTITGCLRFSGMGMEWWTVKWTLDSSGQFHNATQFHHVFLIWHFVLTAHFVTWHSGWKMIQFILEVHTCSFQYFTSYYGWLWQRVGIVWWGVCEIQLSFFSF